MTKSIKIKATHTLVNSNDDYVGFSTEITGRFESVFKIESDVFIIKNKGKNYMVGKDYQL